MNDFEKCIDEWAERCKVLSDENTRQRTEIEGLRRRLTQAREALEPLKELRINADEIESALKRLGPIGLRDEAYVKVATETLVRIMRKIATPEPPRGDEP